VRGQAAARDGARENGERHEVGDRGRRREEQPHDFVLMLPRQFGERGGRPRAGAARGGGQPVPGQISHASRPKFTNRATWPHTVCSCKSRSAIRLAENGIPA
jgi:hypothetical protein